MEEQISQDSCDVEMTNSKGVLLKIANLYAEQLMSDVCLVVGANRYPAHRVILCASSDVFQVMLMNPEWNECRESVIELKEDPMCSMVFPQFLKYLYVGQIKVSIQTVMPMLELADKYNIKDLVELCVDYMMKHIAKAATQGYLVSWFQYTISLGNSHVELTQALQNFLKWNLNIVSESNDFNELCGMILVTLLQQNDIVVQSEFTLFEYLEKWLLYKKDQLDKEQEMNEEEKLYELVSTIEAVFVHVRFAMMSPSELAQILVRPILQYHKEFFVERVAIGMSYHSGQEDRIREIRAQENGALQFTPRLYTTDVWGLSMKIDDFEGIENYRSFVALFFSQQDLSECQEEQSVAWEIEFFPRGVRFNRAKLIGVFNTPVSTEIPESIIRTVRLKVLCQEKLEEDRRFTIGVLISGVQNRITYIRTCHVRTAYFSNEFRVLNIDNLIPYEELKLSAVNLSPHLIGEKRDTIQLHVIIAPLGEHASSETPPFEFRNL
ncbi:BTB/POZ domain-containing protein 17 [Toxorhynchites rutilus septentrionalis]|uniref:BTB/POZ domain-containing protein 17 n=1 Tax=Toxorhynchites rutilus septentrionalis TaxID=329112 RepID=UPI00247AFC54|nr:BTB/POZ domain-containing protein 17 [Toxorhynchites rutilus septentrionalis]